MEGTTIRKMPVGIQDFEKLRTEGYVYVDKTGSFEIREKTLRLVRNFVKMIYF